VPADLAAGAEIGRIWSRCGSGSIIRRVQRPPIQQLSPGLVNRIAAGEVIERPASVVKELVENALDAGAGHITIEIEDGGRELIRVTDDGQGIPADQLALAFAAHATSKLSCDDDLAAIATMGFRGEALASIGSVSHARILSRTAEQQAAYEIRNHGGALSDPQAAPGNVGTSVEVRNLFFNTPARRKFLKGAATESGHISEMVLRLALPHPQVHFKLLSGARTVLDLPATTPEERLLCAWPADFREQRLPLSAGDVEVRLSGLVGLPEVAGPTAKHQYFYLNGRHIRDRFLQHALKEAYRGLTEPGRQPAAVLLLAIPPADVDVNVHPTKAEVRFRDSGRIHGLVLASVREKLLGSDLSPRAQAQRDQQVRPDMRARLAEFLRQGTAAPPADTTAAAATPTSAGGDHAPQPAPQPPARAPVWPPPPPPPAMAPSPPAAGASPMPPQAPASVLGGSRFPAGRSGAIQLHNTYLVTETDEGMVIIDQHALHERIMYEELLARLSRGPLESQRLLIPAVVNCSARQMALLEQLQPLLQRLGIEVGVFGPDSIAVQSFPVFLQKLDPERFMADLLERAEQEAAQLSDEDVLHELLDMMACKAAVKAGDPLTAPEIEALLARRELVERSSNCPHGRPTTLRLTLDDLEKQFKRTGF